MIFLAVSQWLAFALFPVAAGWFSFVLAATALFRFRDTRVLAGAMMFASTVFVATLACWGLMYLDLLLGFHGVSGIVQTVGLSIVTILACTLVGLFGRNLARSLGHSR